MGLTGPCEHSEVTPPDDNGLVICCRCLDAFKPKPSMTELIERLENLGDDPPPLTD